MIYTYYLLANLLGSPPSLGIPDNDGGISGLDAVLNGVYFVAGVVAVVVIIIGGIGYITSGGDSSKVTKAKNTIVFAVIGLVLVIVAFALTNLVIARAS